MYEKLAKVFIIFWKWYINSSLFVEEFFSFHNDNQCHVALHYLEFRGQHVFDIVRSTIGGYFTVKSIIFSDLAFIACFKDGRDISLQRLPVSQITNNFQIRIHLSCFFLFFWSFELLCFQSIFSNGILYR